MGPGDGRQVGAHGRPQVRDGRVRVGAAAPQEGRHGEADDQGAADHEEEAGQEAAVQRVQAAAPGEPPGAAASDQGLAVAASSGLGHPSA